VIAIVVNGESKHIASGQSILDLVRSLDLPVERLAVEHNRKIIKRDHWGTQLLVDGDKIEIVQFVGGGNGWNS
jgi:thiamine biosynthesis protein ThiS